MKRQREEHHTSGRTSHHLTSLGSGEDQVVDGSLEKQERQNSGPEDVMTWNSQAVCGGTHWDDGADGVLGGEVCHPELRGGHRG